MSDGSIAAGEALGVFDGDMVLKRGNDVVCSGS
jgi:hypothetical protein